MKKENLFLIFILLAALFLRVYKLDKIPPGLNRDEASIGYTAYSILKTGKDEYGHFLPLSIKSFGDWKLPFYVYLDIPFIALLGVNEFSVRLPAVLFGSLTVLVTFFLVKELFLLSPLWRKLSTCTTSEVFSRRGLASPPRCSFGSPGHPRGVLAVIACLLLAISPWHIHFSRAAYEATIALFLVVWGVWLFLKGVKETRYLLVSSFLLGLTFYTYHGCHIFTPLLVLGLITIFGKKIKKNQHLAISGFIFLFLALSAYKITLFEADVTKISGIGIFTDKVAIHTEIEKERLFHQDPNAFFVRLLHNRPLFFARTFFEHYLKGYSPEFLFIKGGRNPQHNIPNFGNLNLYLAPFLVMGGLYLIKNFSPSSALIFWWLLASGVAPALTRDAPHSARMLSSLPTWQIISALGIVAVVQWISFLQKNLKTLTFLLFTVYCLLFTVNVFSYLDGYFIHFPKKSSADWNFGLKEVVLFAKENEPKYKKIVMTRPSHSPYIFFLFYQKYDPEKFQKEAVRYPLTEEGFHHVKSFDKYQFVQKINWDDLERGNLYIDWAESVSKSLVPVKTFYLLDGEPIFKLIES